MAMLMQPFEPELADYDDPALGVVNIRSTWRQQADRADAATETKPIATSNAKVQVLKRADAQTATDAKLAPMAERIDTALEAALERFLAARTNETVAALCQSARSAAFDGYDPTAWDDGAEPVACEHVLRHVGGLAESAPDSVTAVSWNCTGAIVAAAYGVLDGADGRDWAARKSVLCAWATTRRSLNPAKADTIVELQDSAACLAFHPEEPTLLAGGSFNGDVLLWDVSNDEEPLLFKSTLSDYSHHEPVTALRWVRQLGRPGHQLVSLGADGRVLVWRPSEEAYRLNHPVGGFTLLAPSAAAAARAFGGSRAVAADGSRRLHGGMALSFSAEDPTSFVAGSEAGLLFKCSLNAAEQRAPASVTTAGNDLTWSADAAQLMSRVPYADYQRTKLKIEKAVIVAREYEVTLSLLYAAGAAASALFPSPIAFTYEPHAGPVYAIAHSPFARNLFLSAGTDSVLRLHSVLQGTALLSVTPTNSTVFCVAWSAARPMVFAAGCADGRIYVYDLAIMAHGGAGAQAGGGAQLQPSEVLQASGKPVFSLAFNPRFAETLSSGDGEGHVKLWKLGARLSSVQQREQDRLDAFVQRLSAAADADDKADADGAHAREAVASARGPGEAAAASNGTAADGAHEDDGGSDEY